MYRETFINDPTINDLLIAEGKRLNKTYSIDISDRGIFKQKGSISEDWLMEDLAKVSLQEQLLIFEPSEQ